MTRAAAVLKLYARCVSNVFERGRRHDQMFGCRRGDQTHEGGDLGGLPGDWGLGLGSAIRGNGSCIGTVALYGEDGTAKGDG